MQAHIAKQDHSLRDSIRRVLFTPIKIKTNPAVSEAIGRLLTVIGWIVLISTVLFVIGAGIFLYLFYLGVQG